MNKIIIALIVTCFSATLFASEHKAIPIIHLLHSKHLEYSIQAGALFPQKSWSSAAEISEGKGFFATGEIGIKGGAITLGYGAKTTAIMAGGFGLIGGATYLKPWRDNTELKTNDAYYGFELTGNAILFALKLGYLKNSSENLTTLSYGFAI